MPHLPGLGALLLSASLSPAEVRAKAEAILASGKYQTALPELPKPPKPIDLPLGPLELLLRILLWTALAVLVVLAVSWLVRRLSGGARDAEVREPAPEAPPEIPIESAEALAGQGRFAEAIHALLLETLAALSRAARLAPSLTSREIVERISLPSRARDALEGLVLAVEVSRFGGAPAAEGDYRACLSRFQAFLDTYRSAA
ncbi:MAG TPA: DUF4129 domain-containing protein [Anaeromyxobacter sp.]